MTAGSGKGLKLEPVRVEASMSDGRGGLVTAAGSLHPEGGRLDLDAAMKRLRLPLAGARGDIQATLSGTASVKGTLMAPQVAADITIDEALVNLNRLTGSSVTTLSVEGTSEAPEPVTEKKEGHGSLDVSVRAPGHIAVNGHGLESEWQAGLRVRGALNDPLVIGSVRSVRGQFDLLSKIFTLRPSTISFNGGAVSNPLLDVTLRYEVPDITADVRVAARLRAAHEAGTDQHAVPAAGRDHLAGHVRSRLQRTGPFRKPASGRRRGTSGRVRLRRPGRSGSGPCGAWAWTCCASIPPRTRRAVMKKAAWKWASSSARRSISAWNRAWSRTAPPSSWNWN